MKALDLAPFTMITYQTVFAAATDAGRRHAMRHGRPPSPWTRADYLAAAKEFKIICREIGINPWELPK